MADDKRGPTAGGKRRRPPPTIDLKATEIASEPVKPAEPLILLTETPACRGAAGAAGQAGARNAAQPRPSARVRPAGAEWLDLAARERRAWRRCAAGWRSA